MPCDTRNRVGQSLTERKIEVREAIAALSASLVTGRAKAVVGPQGAIAFAGWAEGATARVTDACAYRMIMATGSALAKQAIVRAAQLSGRAINSQAINSGWHSHDSGVTFHHGH